MEEQAGQIHPLKRVWPVGHLRQVGQDIPGGGPRALQYFWPASPNWQASLDPKDILAHGGIPQGQLEQMLQPH